MGEAADVGAGVAPGSARHESLTRGYPALYDLLERYRLRATFFVEGWNGVHHPEEVAEIVQRGHELGMHGWVHENWQQLEPQEEIDLARRATAALQQAAGVRPLGFRAPGGSLTAASEGILKQLGYRYDASLGTQPSPSVLPSGLAKVPFTWPMVDGFYYFRREPRDPTELQDHWLQELERVANDGGLFLTISHAFLSGINERRVAALAAVMSAAVDNPHIVIRTAGEIAEGLLDAAATKKE